MEKSAITDEGLRCLASLPELASILLYGSTKFGDKGIAYLKASPHLQELGIEGAAITDAALAHLAKCRELVFVGINDTAVTDKGLYHLRRCTRFRVWICRAPRLLIMGCPISRISSTWNT